MKSQKPLYFKYNASWTKFLACSISSIFVPEIMPFYYVHNLYSQYKHNQSCKFTFQEENRQVVAEPDYIDVYTIYNVSKLVQESVKILCPKDVKLNIVDSVLNAAYSISVISKIFHFTTDSYGEYNYSYVNDLNNALDVSISDISI